MTPPILFAVPNVSEGRDARTIDAIGTAFVATRIRADSVRLLDVHFDADHHRSVFTLTGAQGELADALLAGARAAVELIDVVGRASAAPDARGKHPHVGAVDVMPLVYLDAHARGAACAEALVVADRIGCELGVPVFLYGELSGEEQPATRAQLRRGGLAGLAERMARPGETGEGSRPDFGPARMHASAGATLVAAREPLVAFNLQLQASASVSEARAIAALIREGGAEGIVGLRAIGVELGDGAAQVSMNVERPLEVTLASIVEAVARHARPASGELVGLAPRAALEGFPEDLAMPGFDPARHVIENALGS